MSFLRFSRSARALQPEPAPALEIDELDGPLIVEARDGDGCFRSGSGSGSELFPDEPKAQFSTAAVTLLSGWSRPDQGQLADGSGTSGCRLSSLATVVIAFLFTRLKLLSTRTATEAVLFSTVIFLAGGIIGTVVQA